MNEFDTKQKCIEHGSEVLTAMRVWPMREVDLNGQTFLRPASLERE